MLHTKILSVAQRPDLAKPGQMDQAWPTFMLHDPIGVRFFDELASAFPEFQLMLIDEAERVLGAASCIPLRWEGALADLPDSGWDWALEKGMSGRAQELKPNLASALQIALLPEARRHGLSAALLAAMRTVAREQGMKSLVAPVRPSWKERYPLTPIDRYIRWTDGKELPFDPWLRVHSRAKAAIVKPAHASMRIPGTVAQWEEWTGMRFPESGPYVVPGALVPVEIDCKNDLGLYIEPNVWMHHDLA